VTRVRTRHAQLHLPPLGGEEACRLVHILDNIIRAVWRAHGEQMVYVIERDHDAPETHDGTRPSEPLDDHSHADEDTFDDIPF
jgi:hypothetical protein